MTRKQELEALRDSLTEALWALTTVRQEQAEWLASAKGHQDTPDALEEDNRLDALLFDAQAAVDAANDAFGPEEQDELHALEQA